MKYIATALLLLASTALCAQTTMTTTIKGNTQMTATTSTKDMLYVKGGITRGPQDKKVMAIQFTGDKFAEGTAKILDTLAERNIKATFYFTGDFFRNPEFKHHVVRMIRDEHYVGPHGDGHLLYASWENPAKLLVDKKTFDDDLLKSLACIEEVYGIPRSKMNVWNPPFQHYTEEISQWSTALGVQLVNYTPGTLTMKDYMLDNDPRYSTSQEMVNSVYAYETKDPAGLNGFIMHMHVGAGPERTKDHLFNLLPDMLDELIKRGYSFVRVDELVGMRQK